MLLTASRITPCEPSEASMASFDIREDEEQYSTLVEILDLLVSAGYFRAKIQGLSAFDKIVGGMVWCISLCAESVDVDLLYSENSTIGQKIALTENIVKVLPRFKCPYALEPHQIQGLDCIHILPVLKWLVAEAIAAKVRTGDEVLAHAGFQFRQLDWQLPPSLIRICESSPIASAKPQPKQRIFVRPSTMKDLGLIEDVQATLLEYGHAVEEVVVEPEVDDDAYGAAGETTKQQGTSKQANVKIVERLMGLQAGLEAHAPTKGRMSGKAVSHLINSSGLVDMDSLQAEVATAQSPEVELSLVMSTIDHLRREKVDEEAKFQDLSSQAAAAASDLSAKQAVLEAVRLDVLSQITSLVTETRQAKADLKAFKRTCNDEILKLQEELDGLEDTEPGNESAQLADAERAVAEASAELSEVDGKLNSLSQKAYILRQQVGASPSQLEINQYQKRLVELCNQLTKRHREVKSLYSLHNTKIDVRNFIKQEIGLLNNIDDIKQKAIQEEYKDSFIASLKEILRTVDASMDRISTRGDSLQREHNSLKDELQTVIDKRRVYNNAVADFQAECLHNEQLSKETKQKN